MPPRQYFGTDGVRGAFGSATMNGAFAWRLGAAAGRFARLRHPAGGRVLIGRDTRESGPSLVRALAAGMADAGLAPVSLGVVPTPAVSLALRRENAVLGAVVTASHNPAGDNGIKFFGPGGVKLTDDEEAQIEALLPAEAGAPGAPPVEEDGETPYVEAAAALLPPGCLQGWRVVLDTAHGAAVRTSPAVLLRLGAELVRLGDAPDGRNINAGVGSQHPEALAATVRDSGARIGIAHDGDADRCVLCDETGGVLDGDEILAILALHALEAGRLPGRTLVVTVQSNLGLDAAIAAAGGRVVRTAVGDRYVIEGMRAEGAQLGGESSGHVICADISPTGDGLVAALRVLGVMRGSGQPLSVLRRVLRKFPQRTSAIAVREKRPLESLQALGRCIAELEAGLGTRGRVMVRYSGTEPRLRLLVEGPDDATVDAALGRLEAAARLDLGLVG